MAKIIKRKSDNLVIAVLDDDNVVNLGSNGSTYNNGGTYNQDMTDSTHEVVTDVTPPTAFFSGYFTYDTDWTFDSDAVNRYNEMADEVGLPRIEVEL
mgnify:FL=1|tara:strand:+ start:147 stop:437 length:291 start_codon:yes stop_codon:yes gene_type:complete